MNLPRPGRAYLLLPVLALAACNSGGGGGVSDPAPAARVLVTSNTTQIEPSREPAPSVDLSRLPAPRLEQHYRVSTPVDEPFAFEVVSWAEGAEGAVTVGIAHVRNGDTTPADTTSLVDAGILPSGSGLAVRDGWVEASGDGFVRLSLQGRIKDDQVLAVVADGETVSLIEITIGQRSEINRPGSGEETQDGVVSRQAIYSSNAPQFGLPTVAVSGDRTSIVCYEGDHGAQSTQRLEMRLQHAAGTGAVTGGGSVETSLDTGYWRDHEICALHNVLAVARAETTGLSLRLSYDRGASFAQEVVLPVAPTQSRLVQTSMAADYTLAVAFWSVAPAGDSVQLMLVEGGPIAFDTTGSPTWFEFGPAQVVHTMPANSTPLTTGIAWSGGGDLVIGYGATWFENQPGFVWRARTEFRCAVRHFGETMEDRLVDEQEILGMDPTVAVLGQGSTMRIFYAYEVQGGIRLATSEDGGASFTLAPVWGGSGDHLPAVFAREVAGKTRVDVVWLASRQNGLELHRAKWLDWPSSSRVDEELTTARIEALPPQSSAFGVPISLMRSTQVGWLGFDAVQDGGEIVVVYDEATTENFWCIGPPQVFAGSGTILPPTTSTSSPFFQPAVPPPLAPGMTEAVPAVDADHAHQLVLLRLR